MANSIERFRRHITKVFASWEIDEAEDTMSTNILEAKRNYLGKQLGYLPNHGAQINGQLVEQCPGVGFIVNIEDGRGMCEVCQNEFTLSPIQ